MASPASANEIDTLPRIAAIPLVIHAFGVYLVCGILAWVARSLFYLHRGEVSTAVFQGCMVAMSLWLLKRSGISWEQAGLRSPLVWKGWLLGIVGILLIAFSATFLLLVTRSAYDPTQERLPLLRQLFWTVIYCPIAEEICFRGWFQSSLVKLFEGTRTVLTILLSGLVFGLMHAGWYLRGRPGRTVLIGVIASCLLGWICARARQRNGSIIPAIVLHAAYNLTGILIWVGIDWILAHPSPYG